MGGKVPCGFPWVPPIFHQVLRGLRDGPGRPSIKVSQGSTEFHKGSTNNVSCARRLKSHRSSKLRAQKIAVLILMGGTLSKTEMNVFSTLSLL